ncbi:MULTISPECIES: NAD(P)-dependent alcohol dehydrogenase [Thermomonospora]|uniref:Alcohol dehydrogenase zinc-binding domain protein n=1 Tax=Thermomonospora curvata (strain ATCC 19995 / DSM 43183 / JCM 3096 / KCTC 9072 / NBRC 15933 / NCIMB 10081 / Henssen B9) TaxID=471852 RepID=D1A7M9_THECD|nr:MULTISPECIES: NAD(P)-dependent alcohol dehydrogenase [Thermomonospora]ACY96618.1 Alcohol dehydrogenase zinc-binding domain protein [Thermomonospora curvata DSM 43183]PKK15420.1 MAG: NAD(P)-dependent alcohol dehydrogenase [Thermomonospora sp. CIF 1]
MKITAALVRTPGEPPRLEEAEVTDLRPDEVLVRIVAAGICHTDLVVAAGQDPAAPPLVPGHEGAGVVEAVGEDVGAVEVGDHVVLSYGWCGDCANCVRGAMAYCADFLKLNYFGTRPDGSTALSQDGRPVRSHFFGQSSWATYSVTTERNVVRVDPELPLEHLAPLGCGVQTGAGAVLNVLAPREGSSIAIFGAGAVGLSAVMAAGIAGCDPIVAVDPDPRRRALARELGATAVIDPAEGDPAAAIVALTGGVDHAVECVGRPEAVRAAVGALTAPGMCVTLGFQGTANPVELDQRLLMMGRGIRGCIEGDGIPQRFIPRLIEHYRSGELPLERLVRTYPFTDLAEVFAARGGDAVKPVLVF